jgi:hypothetical protein
MRFAIILAALIVGDCIYEGLTGKGMDYEKAETPLLFFMGLMFGMDVVDFIMGLLS